VSLQAVLLPLFVEVVLTFVLMLWMGALRGGDFRSGSVRPADVALREPNWTSRTMQAAYSFSNQFELPVLFYVLTILEWVTRHAGYLFVVLAWIFVACRVLQSVRACDQQHLQVAQFLLFCWRGGADGDVGDLYRRSAQWWNCVIVIGVVSAASWWRCGRMT
jgi:hypothetical protein